MRILKKLEQVRARGLSCFGSESHEFRLNPPAGEVELQAFENQHGIRLPEAYRAFLRYAGNGGPSQYGGAGPYYGIYALNKWRDFADWVVDHCPTDFLARPSPLHSKMTAQEWDQLSRESPYQGTLSLGTMGCTGMMQLVVTGACAGRVVYVDADGNRPYMVPESDFLSWYERWLDELLAGYRIGSFGFGPGGGEQQFLQILDDPRASDDDKSEAAAAFTRLPHLSDPTIKRIPEFLSDSIAGVRAGACRTVRTFEISDACTAASRLLEDPTPEVRREAIWTTMKLDAGASTAAVLRRLEDESSEVAVTAFFELKKAGALSKTELLRIIQESPHGTLRYYAAHGSEWSREDLHFLVQLLSDSHAQVRFHATLGLRKLKAKDKLPVVIGLLKIETDDLVISSILKMMMELGDASVVPVLLEWAKSTDDLHRLDAIEALVRIGAPQAVPIVKTMLKERRKPVRRDSDGLSRQSSAHNICDLVSKMLKGSPDSTLRNVAD